MSESSHNYKLTIAYDGTHYCGWQIQPNGLSIQEIMQEKIHCITREKITLIGSGRTDAGVHALGQVANFHTSHPLNLFRFLGSLNSLLPKDIRLLNIVEVPKKFHAQYSPTGKIYHYHLHLEPVINPFTRLYSLHVKEKIDLILLKECAAMFLGTHDFTAFSNQSHLGSASRDPVRTIYRLDIIEQPGGVRMEFEGDGFLYKMVRNMVGTLLEIAMGKWAKEKLLEILTSKDRRNAGQAVPSHGLFLMKVLY